MEDYLTAEEVAGLFRVTPQTVRNWVRAGRLRGHWPSERVVRIPREEVERLRQPRIPRPAELHEPRSWKSVLAEYEHHFGISTQDLLQRRTNGEKPQLQTVEDVHLYDAWIGAAELALSAGLLEIPRVPTTA